MSDGAAVKRRTSLIALTAQIRQTDHCQYTRGDRFYDMYSIIESVGSGYGVIGKDFQGFGTKDSRNELAAKFE